MVRSGRIESIRNPDTYLADRSGTLIRREILLRGMRCHYCDREAEITAESDGVRVGLCPEHFREQVQELAESEGLEQLESQLDIDGE